VKISPKVTHPSLISFLFLTLDSRQPHKSRAKSFSVACIFRKSTQTWKIHSYKHKIEEFSEKQEDFSNSQGLKKVSGKLSSGFIRGLNKKFGLKLQQ
jgi:hypothetical protein